MSAPQLLQDQRQHLSYCSQQLNVEPASQDFVAEFGVIASQHIR